MRLRERAFLYIYRKRVKSLLLFITIILLSSFGIAGLLLRSITDSAIIQIRENFSGAFHIAPNMQNRAYIKVSETDGQTNISYIGDPLNDKIVNAILSNPKINAYNAVIKKNVMLYGDVSLVDFNGKYQDDPVAMHLISAEADTSSLYSQYFQKSRLQMTEGDHITGSDSHAAIISNDLALLNHWKIGDSIQLSPRDGYEGKSVTVTIKGLFEVMGTQQNIDVAAPVHLLENLIFIDMESAGLLTNAAGADSIEFFVDDPAQVLPIIDEILKIQDINWECFSVTADIEEYEKIATPLRNMSVLLHTLLIIIGAMSIVILSLIQTLFHKTREHEIGIMLSIGISRMEIILQHFVEMAMIAFVSFIVSFLSCFIAWNRIRVAASVFFEWDIGRNLDTGIIVQTAVTSVGCGIIVLFLSVLISNLWLMRLSPKKILSKL